MKTSKKIFSLFLVITLISAFSISASAQTHWLYTHSYYDNQCCVCSLNKPGKKDAKVTVSVVSTSPVSIKMTDAKNRTIWSEENAIKITKNVFGCKGSRKFNLGRNHSVYKLYFKSRTSASISVKSPKNCTIK